MFFPKEMTEIELVVPSKDLLAVTKILSRHGVFHQTDSNYPGVNSGSASSWQESAAAYAALERRIQTMMQTLDIEEGQPSAEYDATIELETIRPVVDQSEEEVKKVSDQLADNKKRLDGLENDLGQLEPIADIDTDLDFAARLWLSLFNTWINPHCQRGPLANKPYSDSTRFFDIEVRFAEICCVADRLAK